MFQGEAGPGGQSRLPALLHGLNISAQAGLQPSEALHGFPLVMQETNLKFQAEMTNKEIFNLFSSFAQVHSREALPSLIHNQYLFL